MSTNIVRPPPRCCQSQGRVSEPRKGISRTLAPPMADGPARAAAPDAAGAREDRRPKCGQRRMGRRPDLAATAGRRSAARHPVGGGRWIGDGRWWNERNLQKTGVAARSFLVGLAGVPIRAGRRVGEAERRADSGLIGGARADGHRTIGRVDTRGGQRPGLGSGHTQRASRQVSPPGQLPSGAHAGAQ